jgi:hypothetical protein
MAVATNASIAVGSRQCSFAKALNRRASQITHGEAGRMPLETMSGVVEPAPAWGDPSSLEHAGPDRAQAVARPSQPSRSEDEYGPASSSSPARNEGPATANDPGWVAEVVGVAWCRLFDKADGDLADTGRKAPLVAASRG